MVGVQSDAYVGAGGECDGTGVCVADVWCSMRIDDDLQSFLLDDECG